MAEYYDKKKLYGLKSIEFPIVLLVGSKYRTLSPLAKIAWMLFLNRYKLSIKNGFEEPVPGKPGKMRAYFYFTNESLMRMLNVSSKSTVTRIKKELVKAHLIEVKRVGLNSADKIYLIEQEITDDDIEQIDKIETAPQVPQPTALQRRNQLRHARYESKRADKPLSDARSTESVLQSNHSEGSEVQKLYFSETPRPEPEVQKLYFSEKAHAVPEVQKVDSIFIDTLLDTKRDTKKETKGPDFDPELEQMYKDGLKAGLPPHVFAVLDKMLPTYDAMRDAVGLIYRAKSEVEKASGDLIAWETGGDALDRAVYETLCRAFRVIRRKEKTRSGRPVAAPESYIYASLVKCFYDYEKRMTGAGGGNLPDRNWLDE